MKLFTVVMMQNKETRTVIWSKMLQNVYENARPSLEHSEKKMMFCLTAIVLASIASSAEVPRTKYQDRLQDWSYPDISLEVCTAKASYQIGEKIDLDVRIQNQTEDVVLYVDSKFLRTWNLLVDVYNEDGAWVEYPGWNMTSRVIQPRSKDDFVLIGPSRYYGDPCAYSLRLEQPGTYQIKVSLYPGATAETVKKLKIEGYLPGKLSAPPVKILVSPSD